MNDISADTVARAVAMLAADNATDEMLEAQLDTLVGSDLDARRLRYCIPEAFGLVLAAHLCPTLGLPDYFQAMDDDGNWKAIPLSAEPVFVHALPMALHTFHHGPRARFRNVAEMSSVVDALNNALNAGGSLDGCTLHGPQIHGLLADLYNARLDPALERPQQ